MFKKFTRKFSQVFHVSTNTSRVTPKDDDVNNNNRPVNNGERNSLLSGGHTTNNNNSDSDDDIDFLEVLRTDPQQYKQSLITSSEKEKKPAFIMTEAEKKENQSINNVLNKFIEMRLISFRAQNYIFDPVPDVLMQKLAIQMDEGKFTTEKLTKILLNVGFMECDIIKFQKLVYENFGIHFNYTVSNKENSNKNEPKSFNLNIPETIEGSQKLNELLSLINMGQKETEKSENKDLILFIGNTGAGKSTIINYLNGCQFELVNSSAFSSNVKVAESSEIKEIATIGITHSSTTLIPKIISKGSLHFLDCPGLFDSRGSQFRVANAINIKNIMKTARSIKLVLIVDYHNLKSDYGRPFKKLIKNIKRLLDIGSHQNLIKYNSSILIIVNKIPLGSTLTEVKRLLEEATRNEETKISTVAELKDNIVIVDVLEREKSNDWCQRDEILNKLNYLEPIENKSVIFKPMLDNDDKAFLSQMSKHIYEKFKSEWAKNNLTEAAQYFLCLNYLKAMEDPSLNVLYDEYLIKLKERAEKDIAEIRSHYDQYKFAQANDLLDKFEILQREFQSILDLSSYVKDMKNYSNTRQIESLIPEINIQIEKLSYLISDSEMLKKALAYDVYEKLKNFNSNQLDAVSIRLCKLSLLNDLPLTILTKLFEIFLLNPEKSVLASLTENCAKNLQKLFNCAIDEIIRDKKEMLNDKKSDIERCLPLILGSFNIWSRDADATLKILDDYFNKNHRVEEVLKHLLQIPPLANFIQTLLATLEIAKKIIEFSDSELISIYQDDLKIIKDTLLSLKRNLQKLLLEWIEADIAKTLLTIHPNMIQDHAIVLEEFYKLEKNVAGIEECIDKLNSKNILPLCTGTLKEHLFSAEALTTNLHLEDRYVKILDLIYDSFKNLQEQLLVIRDKKHAHLLAEEVNNSLEQNIFTDMRNKIITIQTYDITQLSSLRLNKHILNLEGLAKTNFARDNYAVAMINIKRLMEIGKEFHGLNMTPGLEEKIRGLLIEITQEINKVKDLAEKEIKAAFSLAMISSNFEQVPLFTELTKFYQMNLVFEETMPELGLKTIKELCLSNFRAYIEIPNKETHTIVYLFLLAYAMMSAPNSPASELKKIISGFLNQCEQLTISLIGNLLQKLVVHLTLSRYAFKILEDYPVFDRINIAIFRKKACKLSSTVLQELNISSTSALLRSWQHYEIYYNNLITQLIKNLKLKLDTTNIETGMIEQAKKQSQFLSTIDNNFYRYPEQLGELLANIFGEWSYLDATRGGFMYETSSLLQPHPTQVISVMLLFGMDSENSIQNNLLQVGTGEGKSVIAASAAIAFALMGYDVDIACYSPYLAERDQEQFSDLFIKFDVSEAIQYDEIENFLYDRIPKIGSPVSLGKNLLTNSPFERHESSSNAKSILFIDEVDVFFSESFYGKAYHFCGTIRDSDFQQLLREIWQNRKDYSQRNLARLKIQNNQYTTNFLKKYPNANVLLPITINRILHALRNVELNHRNFILSPEGVGYVDERAGVTKFRSHMGYEIFFTYLKFEGKVFSTELVNEEIGFCYRAGAFAYSELPLSYKYILGVTGTLLSLSSHENEILKNNSILQKTQIPSLFERKEELSTQDIENPGKIKAVQSVEVYGDKLDAEDFAGYFFNIRKEIELIIKADRAIIVVFETLERLLAFNKYIELHPYDLNKIKCNILTSQTPANQKKFIITEAAVHGQITLLTKVFGRGCDFVCRDSHLRARGGVEILVSFFPEHESEEIQIAGRTWRQDDPGSCKMMLFLGDLAKFSINNLNDRYQDNNTNGDWHTLLKQKRQIFQQNKSDILKGSIIKAKEKHQETINFIKLFERHSFLANFSNNNNNNNLSFSEAEKQQALNVLTRLQHG